MKIDTKQRIIQTASQLFYRNGYNSTGINEIIEVAGIAKATLYSHFKSKDDLCIGYLRHMNSDFLTKIKAYCSSKKSGKNQVLALFDFLNEFFKTNEFNGCWCIKTVAELPVDNTAIRSEIQTQKEQFIQFISRLVDTNLKGIKNSQSVARQVYLLYESAVGESHLHQKEWPILEAKKICSKVI